MSMDILLDLNKSVDENAAYYFEEAKEARKKVAGLRKAISIFEEKALNQKKNDALNEAKKEAVKKNSLRQRKWFENFRWFFSSDNLLVVGGKDAHSNEEIVKNRMKKKDVYFHAEVFGAPHCFIQNPNPKEDFTPPESTMNEAAIFAVTFSKAWEEARPIADAYSVLPEQVSKTAKPGEYLGTGAFMIYGERNWFKKSVLSCAVGYFPRERTLMCGPLSAIKKHCNFLIELKQGSLSKEKTAKTLKERFEKKGLIFSIDDFVSLLPNGRFEL
ncbi:MAG: NFACT RNA binding domain-containing protein [Candidatus Diapherotrites archaeon]|nr:NFACT RNA binding domain-containing protein [Candidatus Diapherotrites archaeon]